MSNPKKNQAQTAPEASGQQEMHKKVEAVAKAAYEQAMGQMNERLNQSQQSAAPSGPTMAM